ncbi:NAD(P)-binding protein [Trichoderma citrinoviride]|uniref:NAD(P)-binding protein n=1 Tax=Trichoderma citrinoviride TaxID=58853 RepID=A0A2T4B043_9HYPO|nr:NAD(P)-binding protein [Trichoderma citrinoviride]PTB62682.1 NAD(P)-binding protein [Trichoderma citrinoviride]
MAPQTWLITGASSGLGLDLALVAAKQGNKVIATTRSLAKAQKITDKNITVARLDQNEPLEQIKADMDAIISAHGPIDVVVNCAAYVHTGIIEDLTPEDTYAQFHTNVFGALNVYRAVLPHLRAKRSGTLVTIGSMAAWFVHPAASLYNASKAALRWLSIGLASEVKHLGIKHLLVEPGRFRTDLLNQTGNFRTANGSNGIEDYRDISEAAKESLAREDHKQPGDPVKGAQVIYDVVTSTGVAQGKEMPSFLPLGPDAIQEITASAQAAIDVCQEWKEIASSTDYDK